MGADTEKPLLANGDVVKKSAEGDEFYLEFEDVGIWTIMRQRRKKAVAWMLPGQALLDGMKKHWEGFGICQQFFMECYSVSPHMIVLYVISSLWSSTEDAVGLFFSSRILNIMQQAMVAGKMDRYGLIEAIILRFSFTFLSSAMSTIRRRNAELLSNRIRYVFEERMIRANLRLDFAALQERNTKEKADKFLGYGSRKPWGLFESLLNKMRTFTSIISQLGMLFSILRSQHGGLTFGVICFAKAIFDIVGYQSLWLSVAYFWDSNPFHQRMRSLISLLESAEHRVEVISDVLSEFIIREWTKARKLLGDVSDEWPDHILRSRRSLSKTLTSRITDDLPILLYAVQVYNSPQSFSLSAVALMQQASSSLTWTLYEVFRDRDSLMHIIQQIQEVYEVMNLQGKVGDEELRYPESVPEARGMAVTFTNVSFSYPTTEKVVIKNVSFSIKQGQTVVIVGTNGSGKSTLLKLFNRLYDPTSGSVTIDGIPLMSFKADDIRRSMAMLYQTYSHYRLSIRENILLGRPEIASLDEEDEKQSNAIQAGVEEAARLGGSLEMIKEQKEGFETVLHPDVNGTLTTMNNNCEAFKKKMEDIGKQAEVSAGQWQRLALSRLFFRASSERVRLVAADEPSASLDPNMEYELFQRLRGLSTFHGKTMIYVTHRFGYLTKHADLILVMDKGQLVEQGKHVDLLAMGGQYAEMYKVQAEAFAGGDAGQST